MFLLLLAAYVAIAVCVWIVLNRIFKGITYSGPIAPNLVRITLAVAWPIHLWSWFSEFRKELF